MGDDAVSLWLKQAGKYPLLTASEEITLAREVQTWFTSPNPSPQAIRQGQRARARLVCCNLRLVVTIAKKYRGRTRLGPEDLMQAGAESLCRAAEKFDPSAGFKFSTYAYWWIRQGITRTIAQENPACGSRLPAHAVEKIGQLKRAIAAFTQQHGHGPTQAELATMRAGLSISPALWEGCQQWLSPTPSLDALVSTEGDTALIELIAAATGDPYAALDGDDLSQGVKRRLATLPQREASALAMRYGLDGSPATLEEIGAALGVSRERARQLVAAGLRRLRKQALPRQAQQAA